MYCIHVVYSIHVVHVSYTCSGPSTITPTPTSMHQWLIPVISSTRCFCCVLQTLKSPDYRWAAWRHPPVAPPAYDRRRGPPTRMSPLARLKVSSLFDVPSGPSVCPLSPWVIIFAVLSWWCPNCNSIVTSSSRHRHVIFTLVFCRCIVFCHDFLSNAIYLFACSLVWFVHFVVSIIFVVTLPSPFQLALLCTR